MTDFQRLLHIAKSTHSLSDLKTEDKDFLIEFFVQNYPVLLKSSNEALELIGYDFINNEFHYACRKLDCSIIFISATNFKLCCTNDPKKIFLSVC